LLRHVPNILTVLRIFACPVLVYLLAQQRYEAALLLFFIAGVSDALDGYIAKRFNCTSWLGSLLDPLADKLLIICMMIMLTVAGDLPYWLLYMVIFRDVTMMACWFILTRQHTEVYMRPSYISKVNTVLQIILVLAVLIDRAAVYPIPDWFVMALVIATFVTTLASGLLYLWHWMIKRAPDAVGEPRR